MQFFLVAVSSRFRREHLFSDFRNPIYNTQQTKSSGLCRHSAAPRTPAHLSLLVIQHTLAHVFCRLQTERLSKDAKKLRDALFYHLHGLLLSSRTAGLRGPELVLRRKPTIHFPAITVYQCIMKNIFKPGSFPQNSVRTHY